MRFRLRTLLIVLAVVPPAAGAFWWYVGATGNPPVALPLAFTFAALAAIFVVWLTELADYVGLVISGERKIGFPRYKLRTLLIVLGLGPLFLAVVGGATLDGRLLHWTTLAIGVVLPAAWLLSKVAGALIFYGSHEDNRK